MYNTINELKGQLPETKIIQLTDDEKLGTLNEPRATECGENADVEVDSYCGKLYSVPFATPPAEVKRLSLEIWIYNLYKRRMVPEEIEKRYDKAISQLKDIAKGLKTLGVDPAPAAPTEGGAETNKEESDRAFTREKMEGF